MNMNKETFRKEKQRCYTAACELGYSKEIRKAIKASNDIEQIYRLLRSGRNSM